MLALQRQLKCLTTCIRSGQVSTRQFTKFSTPRLILYPNANMAKSLLFTLLACTLQVNAALLPLNHQAIEPRATTPAVPKCTTNSDVVVNGAFFGYPRQSNYDPWTLTTTGSPGCRYLTGYTPCQGFTNGFGDSDPNCLFVLVLRPLGQYQLTRIFSSLCGYGSAGGSTDISQQITYAPGCLYTVE